VLVSTPIGNLGDVSNRAIEVLRRSDLILCEDTRHSARLLTAFGIATRTEPLHEHNEDARIAPVLGMLRAGKRIALVSDAGTPLVSDPGYRLVRAAIAEGLLLGFPPPRQAARRAAFGSLRAAERAGLTATLIWHEAPHRLAETLADMHDAFGARAAAVARELTKHFEEVRRGTLADLGAHYAAHPARGEITVLLGPPEDNDAEDLDGSLLRALADHSVREAAALVTAATGLPRKLVYARALALTKPQPE
jgi:16S rRNA (cytidine1402-2'-O)-methyltransferase